MYWIKCQESGDTAEAPDLASALVAAYTLTRDHADHLRTWGALTATRRSLLITRDGIYDGQATRLAHQGRRTP
jgi:hypothetical protein